MDNKENNKNTSTGYSKGQRLAAMIGIILLLGIIIFAIVAAFVLGDDSKPYVLACVGASFFIGVITYVIQMFYKLSRKKKEEQSQS